MARPAGKPAQAAVDLVVVDSSLAARWIQLRLVERVASLLESPGFGHERYTPTQSRLGHCSKIERDRSIMITELAA